MSPFQALCGRDPCLPPDNHSIKISPKHADVANWWIFLQQNQPLLRHSVQHNLQVSQQRQQKTYPIRRRSLSGPDCTICLAPITCSNNSNSGHISYSACQVEPRLQHVVRMKRYTPPNPTQSTVNISLSHSKDEGGGVESANPSSKNLEFLGTNQEVLTKWEKYKRFKKRK